MYKRLCARMKAAREDAGLSQIEASRRLKKPLNFVNRLESGERRLQILDLCVLANLYKKPLRYFLPETPSENV